MSSRRTFIKQTGALAGLSSAVTQLQAANGIDASAPAPNILWFISDDAFPYLRAYGDKLARTPAIDALAKQGILYRNVFCNAPVCAPSRFGLITGVAPESVGPAQHMRAEARLPQTMRAIPEYLRARGYYCFNNSKTDYNTKDIAPNKVWNESSPFANWRKRPQGKPFYGVITSMTTHESALEGDAIGGKVRPADVRVPAYLPDTEEIRQDIASYYNAMERMDRELGMLLADLEADGLAQDTVVFYFSDNGGCTPRSKRFLYDEGLRSPLIVRVPERWRSLVPANTGARVDTPVGFLDLPATVLAIAGADIPQHIAGRPLIGQGLAASSKRQYAFSTRDRMDERTDLSRAATDGRFRYIRNYLPTRPWGLHCQSPWNSVGYQSWEKEHLAGRLNAQQERFWREKPYEELYDLESDQDQVRNLVTYPQHQARLDGMRAALDAYMLGTNDNGFIPEGSATEGWAESRAAGAYPLEQVMRVAAMAAQRSPDSLGALRAAARDPNDIVRFWAARGLLMLGKEAMPAQADLDALATDKLPHTQVVALEALAHLGVQPERMISQLIDLVGNHPLPRVRLHAVESLDTFDRLPAPVIEQIRKAIVANQDEYVVRLGVYIVLKLKGEYRPDMYMGGGGPGSAMFAKKLIM